MRKPTLIATTFIGAALLTPTISIATASISHAATTSTAVTAPALTTNAKGQIIGAWNWHLADGSDVNTFAVPDGFHVEYNIIVNAADGTPGHMNATYSVQDAQGVWHHELAYADAMAMWNHQNSLQLVWDNASNGTTEITTNKTLAQLKGYMVEVEFVKNPLVTAPVSKVFKLDVQKDVCTLKTAKQVAAMNAVTLDSRWSYREDVKMAKDGKRIAAAPLWGGVCAHEDKTISVTLPATATVAQQDAALKTAANSWAKTSNGRIVAKQGQTLTTVWAKPSGSWGTGTTPAQGAKSVAQVLIGSSATR